MHPGRLQTGCSDRSQRLLETFPLDERLRRTRHLRRGKVRHHAVQAKVRLALEPMEKRVQLFSGSHALACHSGIDLQMNRQRRSIAASLPDCGGESLHLLLLPDNRGQSVPHDFLSIFSILRHRSAHDHDARLAFDCNSGRRQRLANRCALNHVRHSKPLGAGPRQDGRADRCAVPVCIRLYDREHGGIAAGCFDEQPVVRGQPPL